MLDEIKMSKLKKILLELPFYKAIDLFEQQVNLHEAYQLFLGSALKGNVIAIPYIKHLHNYHAEQINLENNIITRYLDYWYNNLPIIEKIDPKYWLQVSLHKILLNNNQILTKEQKLKILNDLYVFSEGCSSAYILLQNIGIGHYLPKITITKSFKPLKFVEPKVIDIFMLVYLANNKQYNHQSIISKYYEFDLNLIYKKLSFDINKYKYHGILELEISEAKYYQCLSQQFIERKFQWQTISMLMGKVDLYYKFSRMHKEIDLNNRINLALFSGLYGNLLYKAIIARSLCRLNNIQEIFIVKKFIFGCNKIPENIKNVKLGDEWLTSFGNLSIEQLKLQINTLYQNIESYEKMISQIYIDCGKLLEILIEENAINESHTPLCNQKTILACYQRACNLGNIYGLYYAGIFYENNPIKNFELSNNLAIAYHEKAFQSGCNASINRLIIIYYHLKNYEKSYNYIKILMGVNLFNANINLINTNDYVPVVYANILINGYAGNIINKRLAYKILLDSAYYGNNFAILEIIKDFISNHQIDIYFKYSYEILATMANKLYHSFNEEDFIEENAANYLIMFFSCEPFLNEEFANKLINQGLAANHFHVIMLFAEYNLYGNCNLKIKQNIEVAIKYYQQLLSMDNIESKSEYKNNILNLLGLALTVRLQECSEDYKLAEQYLLEAYTNKVDYSGYNLACLYFKTGNFSASFELLDLENTKNPFDIDILCDLGVHYLCGTGVKQDLEIAKLYMYRSYGLGSKRAIPNLIILKILEAFWQNKFNFKEIIEYQKLLEEYVESNAIYSHANTCKNSIFLLRAAISLICKPFQYTLIINQLNTIKGDIDYRIEFAIEYLKNKPKNKDINDLGFDLLLILISLECTTKQELEIKFANSSYNLSNNLDNNPNNNIDNNPNELNNCNYKILRFKENLNNFINKDRKSKNFLEDFRRFCLTANVISPEQISCKVKHATTGSGEKIEFIFKEEDHITREVLIYHPEHRSGKNVGDTSDPKRTKSIKKYAKLLENKINKLTTEHAKLCYNISF